MMVRAVLVMQDISVPHQMHLHALKWAHLVALGAKGTVAHHQLHQEIQVPPQTMDNATLAHQVEIRYWLIALKLVPLALQDLRAQMQKHNVSHVILEPIKRSPQRQSTTAKCVVQALNSWIILLHASIATEVLNMWRVLATVPNVLQAKCSLQTQRQVLYVFGVQQAKATCKQI